MADSDSKGKASLLAQAAAKAIRGGRREGSGRKRRFISVEVDPELWLTLEAQSIKDELTLEGAAAKLLNKELRKLRGKGASLRSVDYFAEKSAFRFRRKRYNFPKKLGKETVEPVEPDEE